MSGFFLCTETSWKIQMHQLCVFCWSEIKYLSYEEYGMKYSCFIIIIWYEIYICYFFIPHQHLPIWSHLMPQYTSDDLIRKNLNVLFSFCLWKLMNRRVKFSLPPHQISSMILFNGSQRHRTLHPLNDVWEQKASPLLNDLSKCEIWWRLCFKLSGLFIRIVSTKTA